MVALDGRQARSVDHVGDSLRSDVDRLWKVHANYLED